MDNYTTDLYEMSRNSKFFKKASKRFTETAKKACNADICDEQSKKLHAERFIRCAKRTDKKDKHY